MNPFKSRKKSFAEGDTNGRPSLEKVPPLPSTGRGRPFRRKKNLPEPKPELDIALALPTTEDFRTSLLMPNLSARFSMLREQDDPNSKIGKANDDSVLFPKRASRLNLFGHEGLSDIAEVSSISGSIRRPFANDRANSYSSAGDFGYGTDEDASHGNVMTRAKPGMGNKLFGGRQKIYKIPVEGSGEDGGRSMGKAVYDDDVTMSAFQILRAKEKQHRIEAGEYFDDHEDRSSREQDRRDSPPFNGYNRKRETSSSTNSGPMEGRTSTAATSIASQGAAGSWYASTSVLGKQSPVTTPGADRPSKGKRLYGQGLDQQMFDQQTSALSRLNSIQRGQSGYGAAIGTSRSASNLNERFRASGPFNPAPGAHSGAASPAGYTPGLNGFDFGVNEPGSRSQSKDREGMARQTPPMSPLTSPVDPTLMAALDANDLGKATASGAFNKPKTQYNEQQFAQRQLQLQEGRETPPPRAYSRTDNHNDLSGRLRNGSLASVQSAHSSRNQHYTGPGSRAPSAGSNRGVNASPVEPPPTSNGAFLADLSGSEHGSGLSSPELPMLHPPTHMKLNRPGENASQPTIYEMEDRAHGDGPETPERLFLDPTEPTPTSSATISLPEVPARQLRQQICETEARDFADSREAVTHDGSKYHADPTTDLNDLVRGHLRNQSAQSATSIYPDSPSNADGEFPPDAHFGLESKPAEAAYGTSALEARARQVLAQANQLANGSSKVHDILGGVGGDKVQQVLGGEAPRRSAESTRIAWQEQLKSHTRGPSTETQKEREDFASELADRRRRVQDNLRTFVDDDSRSASPADGSPANNGAMALLRKASRGSLNGKSEQPAKAMKMLGIASAPASSRPSPAVATEPFPPQLESHPLESREPNRGPNPPRHQGPRQRPPMGNGLSDRSIGAERREKFFHKSSPPRHGTYERSSSEGARQEAMRHQQQVYAANSSLPRPRAEPANAPPVSYHPAGRARKYSPPRGTRQAEAPRADGPSRPGSRPNLETAHRPGPPAPAPAPSKIPNAGSYFPSQQQHQSTNPQGPGHPTQIGLPRPPPMAPAFSAHTTPPLEAPPTRQHAMAGEHSATTPTLISPSLPNMQQQPLTPGARGRKQSVNKREISEPTFLSGTSSVITVDLPAGASLANGMAEVRAEAPPVPPINPNRRRRINIPTTQNVFTAFGNKYPNGIGNGASLSQPSSSHGTTTDLGAGGSYSPFGEEKSTFSGDEGEDDDDGNRGKSSSRPGRTRIRKSSSDGGGLAARARHQALLKEADQMPPNPISGGGGGGGLGSRGMAGGPVGGMGVGAGPGYAMAIGAGGPGMRGR